MSAPRPSLYRLNLDPKRALLSDLQDSRRPGAAEPKIRTRNTVPQHQGQDGTPRFIRPKRAAAILAVREDEQAFTIARRGQGLKRRSQIGERGEGFIGRRPLVQSLAEGRNLKINSRLVIQRLEDIESGLVASLRIRSCIHRQGHARRGIHQYAQTGGFPARPVPFETPSPEHQGQQEGGRQTQDDEQAPRARSNVRPRARIDTESPRAQDQEDDQKKPGMIEV